MAGGAVDSSTFGRARAFGALALISGLVFVVSAIVNASAPQITYVNPTPDSDIYTWIRDGLPGGMPGYGSSLTEAQRWDLVNFLRGINGQGPSPDVTPNAAPSSSAAVDDELAGFGVVGGASLLLLGWFSAGVRRTRPRSNSRPTSRNR